MSDQLSNADLDAIERRLRETSSGPWCSFVVGRDMEAGLSFIELGSYDTLELVGGTMADQDFIASARQDVPSLLQEVRALRAKLQLLEVTGRRADCAEPDSSEARIASEPAFLSSRKFGVDQPDDRIVAAERRGEE